MQTDQSDRGVREIIKALEDALSRNESEWFDFKEEGIDPFADPKRAEQGGTEHGKPAKHETDWKETKRAEFVRSILALSNTVQSPGRHNYIFVGVRDDPMRGTNHQLIGVRQHPDGAKLQDLVNKWTRYSPPFEYVCYEYNGFSMGAYVLRGDVHIPYVATRCVGNTLWNDVVYIRRSSMEVVATPDEIYELVERRKKWNSLQPSEAVEVPISVLGPAEEEILLAALDTKDGGIHVLTTGHIGSWVRVGRANYVDKQDPAVAIVYREALQRLVAGGYAYSDSPSGNYYILTSSGWSFARNLARRPVLQLANYLHGDKGLGTDKRIELLGLLSRRANLAEDFDQVGCAIDELVRTMLGNALAWGIPAAGELVRSHLRSGESVSQLISALDRKEPELRRLTVWVLSRSGLPEARNAVITALADPDEQVQALAFWALEKNPPEKARPSMCAIRQKLGSRVWGIAGKTLDEFGDPEAAYTSHRQCSEEAMARLSEQQSEEMMRKGIVRGMPKHME